MSRQRPGASQRSTDHGANQRQLRVGEELRHALARLLERGVLRDPALVGLSITVTEVRVSPDLKNATAFVTPLGGEGGAAAVAALNRASAHLRGQMAAEVRLRHAPRLGFILDTSFDNASRIERALKEFAPGEGDDGA